MSYQIDRMKYLLDSEVDELERLLAKFMSLDTRNCLMLYTLLYTGARASECLAIRREHLSDNSVHIIGLKNSNNRDVPIPEWLFERLVKFAPSEGPLFAVGYFRLRTVWEHYRPVEKKLHSLRHTFAIRQLRKHGQIDVIKYLLGHRNISNTMVYLDYTRTQNDLRRLVV